MQKSVFSLILALFTLLAATAFVSAATGDLTTNWDITVDGIDVSGSTISGIEAGETIPIKVVFDAVENASDVRVKVWIDGYRSEISDKTGRFELVDGSSYRKLLSLTVPGDIDPTEDYSLIVRISDKTDYDEEEFTLRLQRESYNLEVLDVQAPGVVSPGSTVAVDVVLKNRGMHDLEDIFVEAGIAELGAVRRVYFGDLSPQDSCEDDDDDNNDCDKDDAVERRIYLTIPSNAAAGVYNLEVEASNVDSTDSVSKTIVVSSEGARSDVFSGVASRTLDIGEEVTYDLVIVNSGQNLKVYNLVPEDASGLIVDVDPVVTVAGGASKTVKVRVKATESAEEGTQTVVINVESADELVEKVTFTANVERSQMQGSVVVLTVVLAIVFIVLLIILIVLLTKKPATIETEETSYY